MAGSYPKSTILMERKKGNCYTYVKMIKGVRLLHL